MTKTMNSRFPGTCTKCKASFPAGTPIIWTSGVGARHALPTACVAVPVTPTKPVHADVSGITSFIARAARRLKAPKARFLGPDGRSELRISIAGTRSRVPGATVIVLAEQFLGYVHNGIVLGSLQGRADVLATLAAIAADPAKAAKEYGALMCRCSFCNLPLTDAGSVEVGYGPICAGNYDLPWGRQGVPELTALPVLSPADELPDHDPDEWEIDAMIAEREGEK